MMFPHVLLERRVVPVGISAGGNDAGVLELCLLNIVDLHVLFEV